MTDAPESRKTHVIRILGTNKNGDVLQDMWADVERIDIAKSATQTLSNGWQGHQRKHKWMDDPNADDYSPDGNPARKTEIVKVCDVQTEDDPGDPSRWIPIPTIKIMKSKGYDGDNNTGTQTKFRAGLDDDTDPSTRKVEVRKINHYDTNIDDAASAAFDADSSLKAYVVSGSDYQRDDSTKDDTQFVDHEIITHLKSRYNQTNDADGGVDTGQQTKLLNQYLIDDSDDADGTVIGASGINPPYRLDPWQNIVNVQFNSLDQQWLLCTRTGGNIDSFMEFPNPTDSNIVGWSAASDDGSSWSSAMCAASGSGFTVISRGPVAFGTVKLANGSSQNCFLRADMTSPPFVGASVQLGVISGSAISWNPVWSAPAGVQAISFAKDGFFVTYFTDNTTSATNLAVTKDGSTFSTGINPFAGIPSDTAVGGSFCGNVAYNKTSKTYATVGAVELISSGVVAVSMAWAWSLDGFAWSSGSAALFQQPGQNLNVKVTSIAAGNGVFVAAASFKNHYPSASFGDLVDNQCGVAVSEDGSIWSTSSLPGSLIRPTLSPDDPPGAGGDSFAVAFITDRDVKSPDPAIKGYFVVAGTEQDARASISIGKLWQSGPSAGTDWSLVQSTSGALFHGPAYIALSAIDKKIKNVVIV